MREKSESAGPEVSTLDLLSEIEAKLILLQAKHDKLRAAGKKRAVRKKPAPKKLPMVPLPEAAQLAAPALLATPTKLTPPAKPPAKKRPALGRGLAQFIRHRIVEGG